MCNCKRRLLCWQFFKLHTRGLACVRRTRGITSIHSEGLFYPCVHRCCVVKRIGCKVIIGYQPHTMPAPYDQQHRHIARWVKIARAKIPDFADEAQLSSKTEARTPKSPDTSHRPELPVDVAALCCSIPEEVVSRHITRYTESRERYKHATVRFSPIGRNSESRWQVSR